MTNPAYEGHSRAAAADPRWLPAKVADRRGSIRMQSPRRTGYAATVVGLLAKVINGALPNACPACRGALRMSAHAVCQHCRRRLQEFPCPRCTMCGAAVDGILALCSDCLAGGGRHWDQAVTVFPYGGLIRELIHRFKYRGLTALTPFFAHRMAENWIRHGTGIPDMVVPIPLHWRRQVLRGYNQAELLAMHISHCLGLPMARVLRRPRAGRRQALLDGRQRHANVQRAFVIRRRADLAGTHILLVDDVLTTGATLNAATMQLREAGADTISILTLARG